MEHLSDLLLVLTTSDQQDVLRSIARAAVEQGLVACAQISGPITSIYRWEGKVCTEQEYRCLLKTNRASCASLQQLIRRNHNYDVPQIIAVPIVGGDQDYLDWYRRNLDGRASDV